MTARTVFVAAGLCALALPALGEAPAGDAPRNPADPAATTPPATYVSPFANYRPFAHDGPAPWRGVNDEVGRIGGWKAYAREVFEAQQPTAAPGGEPARSPASAPGGPGKAGK